MGTFSLAFLLPRPADRRRPGLDFSFPIYSIVERLSQEHFQTALMETERRTERFFFKSFIAVAIKILNAI